MQERLAEALRSTQAAFGIALTEAHVEGLSRYHGLVQEHNLLLHLVAPCSTEEFAVRHLLESLTLIEHLPQYARLADVGTGAGLPSIPCLIVRQDLSATLIESNQKKGRFLDMAVERLGLADRATVINRQFEEVDINDCRYVTARALEKFSERLPRLLKWARGKKLLLLGGPNLETALTTLRRRYHRRLIPMSRQRYLFVIES